MIADLFDFFEYKYLINNLSLYLSLILSTRHIINSKVIRLYEKSIDINMEHFDSK